MKAFAKVGATLVATSLLFGPVYVSARNGQLTADEFADGTTGGGQLWGSGFGRGPRRDSRGAIDEEGRSNGLEGETKRRSKLSRRVSTSLSHQSGTLQKLLTGALVSMGMLSAVRLGKEFMRVPSGGDEEPVRAGRSSVAGLSSRSIPNGLLVGALTLLVIASTLASPILSEHSRQTDQNADSKKYPSRGFSFFYKGKHCAVTFDAREMEQNRITYEDLQKVSNALSRLPKERKFVEEGGGTEYIWGLTQQPHETKLASLFSLEDGRQYLLELPDSILRCSTCLEKIRAVGTELKKYELRLTSWEEQSWTPRPKAEVRYEWKNGRTVCRVGGLEGDAVATFSIGDTDFKIVLPKEVTEALAGKAGTETIVRELDPNHKLLGELLRELSKQPKMRPAQRVRDESVPSDQPPVKGHPYNPYQDLLWGAGPDIHPFPERLVNYQVALPQSLSLVLHKANNGAWSLLKDLLHAAFPPIQLAMLREKM